MEKNSSFSLINEKTKMPIGYRFLPTDEELVIHYLKPKAMAIPFPDYVIPVFDFDVSQTDPWGLPGDLNEKRRYFFSKNTNLKRANGSFGYWKLLGRHKIVVAPESNQPIGIRKTLVFSQKRKVHGNESRWFLHQFCLLGSNQMEMQDWVVYRLFKKKRNNKKIAKKIVEELSLRSNYVTNFKVDMEKSEVTEQD